MIDIGTIPEIGEGETTGGDPDRGPTLLRDGLTGITEEMTTIMTADARETITIETDARGLGNATITGSVDTPPKGRTRKLRKFIPISKRKTSTNHDQMTTSGTASNG